MKTSTSMWLAASFLGALLAVTIGCGGGGDDPLPLTPDQLQSEVVNATTPSEANQAVVNVSNSVGFGSGRYSEWPIEAEQREDIAELMLIDNEGTTRDAMAYGFGEYYDYVLATFPFLTASYNNMASALQAQVNAAWLNQQDRSNIALILMVSGDTIPLTPPTITREMRISTFQTYLFRAWLVAEYISPGRDLACERRAKAKQTKCRSDALNKYLKSASRLLKDQNGKINGDAENVWSGSSVPSNNVRGPDVDPAEMATRFNRLRARYPALRQQIDAIQALYNTLVSELKACDDQYDRDIKACHEQGGGS